MNFSELAKNAGKNAVQIVSLITVLFFFMFIPSGCGSDPEPTQETMEANSSTTAEVTTTLETTVHLETIPLEIETDTQSTITSATTSETTVSTTKEITDPTTIAETSDNTQNISTVIEAAKESNSVYLSDNDQMDPLLNEILAATGEMTVNMGIYYYDLTNGDMISVNGDRQFRSASTAKIFVVMAMYEAVANGELTLDQIIYYTESDYEGGSGILQNMDLSKGYSLATLAEYAIRHSDNIAFHMIRRAVGRDKCYSFYESVIGHPTNRSQTQMSAEDAGKLLQHAYIAEDGRFTQMLEDMRYTDFEHAIPKNLPANIAANKIGFYLTFFHDAALIYDSDSPYILTIFSDGLANKYDVDPAKVLADLSLKIYNVR